MTAECPFITSSSTTARFAGTHPIDDEHDCNPRLPLSRARPRDTPGEPRRALMAWFRPIGLDEVACHQATVVGRTDDHPCSALDYYGSRGETPLRWGGAGASRLGLTGEVTPEAYEAAFGPGGFRDPRSGVRLVGSRRPGFELVIGAHKSVAVLGVVGHAEAMHSILDIETAATMAALDAWFQERGGRRGRVQERTATGGPVYAVTRHAIREPATLLLMTMSSSRTSPRCSTPEVGSRRWTPLRCGTRWRRPR